MLKNVLILITSVCSLALQTNMPVVNSFFPFARNNLNNPDIDSNDINHSVNIEKSYQPKLLLPFNHDNSDFLHSKFDKLHHFFEIQEKAIGKEVVMKVSAFLPSFDSIGHKILHANNEFVSNILLSTNLPDFIKKDLILFSIKMAQSGDDFGSVLLQMYYDIVNNSL